MKPTRPVLRYHGGKWRLAPWIISHFPAHRVYVEPYGGAASVLMQKPRCYAEIYNDLDGEIVNVFRVLRDVEKANQLKSALRFTPFSRTEFVDAYTPHKDSIEQARRTIVKAYMGFGSAAVTQQSATKPGAGFKPTTGFRNNSNRSGTTPARDWANLPGHVDPWVERLTGVVIENRPAEQLYGSLDRPETLWYVDPPYVHSTRGINRHRTPQSYRYEMSEEDHRAMASHLRALSGFVVVSGYPCSLYDELFEGWAITQRAAHADGARDRTERLWLNPACVSALGGGLDLSDVSDFEEGAA